MNCIKVHRTIQWVEYRQADVSIGNSQTEGQLEAANSN